MFHLGGCLIGCKVWYWLKYLAACVNCYYGLCVHIVKNDSGNSVGYNSIL